MSLENSGETLKRLESQIGGMVEVWVIHADLDSWNSAMEALRGNGYRVELTRLGVPMAGPILAEMFSDDGDQGAAFEMYVDVGNARWWTGIFSPEVIDFQGRPEWVASNQELVEISDFMQVLADATRREVIFIPESLDGNVRRYMTRTPNN